MFGLGKNKEEIIDPIAEADLYFAYGKNEAAIKILQETYDTGSAELKFKITSYLEKNKKLHLLKKSASVRFHYRVHCVEYINGHAIVYKFFVNIKNSKNTLAGIRDIETEAENKINRAGSYWVISFISEALE